MSQYTAGTVAVTQGSATVTGTGTAWAGAVAAGQIFGVVGDGVWYTVAGVTDNTHLALTAPYQGATGAGQAYAVTRDFTPTYGLPLINAGDVLTGSLVSRAMTAIDQAIAALSTLLLTGVATLTGKTLSGATLAGTTTLADGGSLAAASNQFRASIGVGAAASPWAAYKVVDFGGGALAGLAVGQDTLLASNAYWWGGGWAYKTGNLSGAGYYDVSGATHVWSNAPAGTAGAAAVLTERMRLDGNGHLLVGASSGAAHQLALGNTQGTLIVAIDQPGSNFGTYFFGGSNVSYYNGAAAIQAITKNSTTGRSINAGGTVNTGGADYAEYEVKRPDCGALAKGQIVGRDGDGRLTDKWSVAVTFGIKSTDPSFVGGDVWGGDLAVGAKPAAPIRKPPVTEQQMVTASVPAEIVDGQIATPEQPAVYRSVVTDPGDTDDQWAAVLAQYATDLAAWEAKLEVERARVDRIAKCGRVPVNLLVSAGGVPGDYVVPVAGADGSISGQIIPRASLTLAQYVAAIAYLRCPYAADTSGRWEVEIKVG